MPKTNEPVDITSRVARNLTAEHVRRVKRIFADHIADAALKTNKLRISELKLLQGKLVSAIKFDEVEG